MAVNGIIGIKLGMTQVFTEDGALVGCTVLQAGPCVVVQRRTKTTDGYEAAQLGLVEFVKPQRVNKAMTGHYKKANVAPMKVLREVRITESNDETKVGRSRSGRCVQERRVRRCDWRQQGPRLCGRRQALALRRRRCVARFDVSPRARRHRRQFVSVARLEESAFSGSHGQHRRDGAKFESDQGRYRREPAVGSRFGAGTSRARTSSSRRFARRLRRPHGNEEFCKGRPSETGTSCKEQSRSNA